MCNEFEKNEKLNSTFMPFPKMPEETSVQTMLMDFLKVKSNNARIENKYASSLRALKLFIEPN